MATAAGNEDAASHKKKPQKSQVHPRYKMNLPKLKFEKFQNNRFLQILK